MAPQQLSAEEIFDMVIPMIDTGEVGLCVIDSIGVMLSKQAYDKDIAEKTYGGIAMALTNFSKRAVSSCSQTGCLLIGINQMRDDMNSAYGGKTTVGGKAWKHNCSVRLEFSKGDPYDEKRSKLAKSADNPYGHKVMIAVKKTKISKPNRKGGSYSLDYNTGLNADADYIDLAITQKWIIQGGAWFTFQNPITGELLTDENDSDYKCQGLGKIPTFLSEHPKYWNLIKKCVNNTINDLPIETGIPEEEYFGFI